MAMEEDIGLLGGFLQEAFSKPEGLRRLLEAVVNAGMREEAGLHVGADDYERSGGRRGHRNGHKPRKLGTRVGQLELSVPQVRGCEPYHPSLFARWQRSERALLVACGEMYFQGVSTRNVQKVLQEMCGFEISSTTVSRVALELDEKLSAFRERRLDGVEYAYLLIDARYEKVRVAAKVVSQAVLVTVGITRHGGREVLDWRLGDSESEATWGEVFRSLKDRGLRGIEMVTSDAHGGIRSALDRHFQGVPWQRCRVHYKREMGRKVSFRQFKELNKDLAAVLAPQERAECLKRGEEMACRWERRYPAVARMLREDLEDCLTVLNLPEHHQKKLKSTNLLENMMKQLKKRTRVVGVFPNRASCDRLVGAHLLELHEKWSVQERSYINMEYAGA
jgi:transposase-like protein